MAASAGTLRDLAGKEEGVAMMNSYHSVRLSPSFSGQWYNLPQTPWHTLSCIPLVEHEAMSNPQQMSAVARCQSDLMTSAKLSSPVLPKGSRALALAEGLTKACKKAGYCCLRAVDGSQAPFNATCRGHRCHRTGQWWGGSRPPGGAEPACATAEATVEEVREEATRRQV